MQQPAELSPANLERLETISMSAPHLLYVTSMTSLAEWTVVTPTAHICNKHNLQTLLQQVLQNPQLLALRAQDQQAVQSDSHCSMVRLFWNAFRVGYVL